jgi:hypothetical protein
MQSFPEATLISARPNPKVIFETDGRHSSVYVYEPPMGARKYCEPIDEVRLSRALSYSPTISSVCRELSFPLVSRGIA